MIHGKTYLNIVCTVTCTISMSHDFMDVSKFAALFSHATSLGKISVLRTNCNRIDSLQYESKWREFAFHETQTDVSTWLEVKEHSIWSQYYDFMSLSSESDRGMYWAPSLTVLFSIDFTEVFYVFIKPFDIVHSVMRVATCWGLRCIFPRMNPGCIIEDNNKSRLHIMPQISTRNPNGLERILRTHP